MPRGPIARRMLSAHPSDMLRNCFVTCSPKSVKRGARSVPRLLRKSSPSKSDVGAVSISIAVGVPMPVEVVAVGAIIR